MDCIFCKIAKKEIPAGIIFENEKLVIFKDIKPSAPVHFLVVPKEHVESINHLKISHREIIADLIYVAKDVSKKAGLRGYKLVFNVGKEGGQIIGHLHLHVLGGWNKKSDIDSMPCPSLDK